MNRDDVHAKLAPAIEAQLNDLAQANHCGAGSIVKGVNRAELRTRLASVDRLACEVELVSVTEPKLSSLATDRLQQIADHLAASLTYLEEQLIVLEVDPLASQVQMRSKTPRVEAEAKSYFELHVGKLGVHLQRYRKEPSIRREQVAATFTRDVLTRLCVDIVSAVVT